VEKLTFAPYSRRLPPSGPNQKRVKTTTAWAIMSCGSRNKMPAALVSCAPAKIIEHSRSAGMPSSCEPDDANWATVARGFARWETWVEVGAMMLFACVVVVALGRGLWRVSRMTALKAEARTRPPSPRVNLH
jgi:hypothetical protein